MDTALTKDEYIRHFQENVLQDKIESGELKEYLEQQFVQLDQLTSTVSPDNFWVNIPKILGIDAKLTLIIELISYDYDQLPIKEILRIVEKDYRTYFKEICGNELRMTTNSSLVFHVL